MKEPTETTSWVVIVLLAIAAIIVNTSFGSTNLGVILVTILAAICGRLVLKYQ